jgi:TIR domain
MASDPPKVLISYSHDSPEHKDRVLVLSNRLRGEGIDCTIDQYLLVPPEGWPRWMEKQIRESDFVLMVCTETITGASWASPIPTEGGARVFYSPPLWLQSSETKEGRRYI